MQNILDENRIEFAYLKFYEEQQKLTNLYENVFMHSSDLLNSYLLKNSAFLVCNRFSMTHLITIIYSHMSYILFSYSIINCRKMRLVCGNGISYMDARTIYAVFFSQHVFHILFSVTGTLSTFALTRFYAAKFEFLLNMRFVNNLARKIICLYYMNVYLYTIY